MAQVNNQPQGGSPALPQTNFALPQQTAVTPTNIFDLIKQSTQNQMSSVLPYVQAQYAQQSQNVAPMAAAIKQQGESDAASAQSDAQGRGMRGSDIEAAGMSSARQAASAQVSQMYAQLAQQQAQQMAQAIMTTYGYDVQANQEMFLNLAQAIGQELSQQREQEMFQQQLAQARAAIRSQRSSAEKGAWIGAGADIASALIKM